MSLETAFRIILKYMGAKLVYDESMIEMPDGQRYDLYNNSIDSLVPVWEKLKGFRSITLNNGILILQIWHSEPNIKSEFLGAFGTFQEAACIATALAIEELG